MEKESGLQNKAHVCLNGKTFEESVFASVDIFTNSNGYFKTQLLASNVDEQCFVFTCWGRIGTNIRDRRLKFFADKRAATDYYEGPSNQPSPDFVKLDMDYGDTYLSDSLVISQLESKVQDLLKYIRSFQDVDSNLPLGRLSAINLEKARKVLDDIRSLIIEGGKDDQFLKASNRFYSLIPHNFGMRVPQVIDSTDLIARKFELLCSLTKIECHPSVNELDNFYALQINSRCWSSTSKIQMLSHVMSTM